MICYGLISFQYFSVIPDCALTPDSLRQEYFSSRLDCLLKFYIYQNTYKTL